MRCRRAEENSKDNESHPNPEICSSIARRCSLMYEKLRDRTIDVPIVEISKIGATCYNFQGDAGRSVFDTMSAQGFAVSHDNSAIHNKGRRRVR